ncbi:extracellular solute-binding protein [Geobacter metallireducens RCH3]|uniref:Periplasmic solute-binding protein n=1 Tax=Geobacter metallireducens (strain ATCC 53774 / DSM 7210 / GS-15) TaxID=269799 RepID=Q39XK1_GEOMG|nr:substrate-binding domain-containing protein [Geobacter metallireducens]ABB31023.1 periplasmic solute-binding protein [Geobacter metallireducens GS-15]EHP86029.1 extracellular solute-binding protein [Geobacter metallireducens RCH3]
MRHSIGPALSLVAALMFFALLTGPCRVEAAGAETIRVNGSGSALYVMRPLIKAYLKAHPGVRIEMEKPLGSSGAVKALLAGGLDMVVSSKVLKSEEAAQGGISREYGKMPLVVVTGKQVSKRDITTKELEDIYSGKVRTWPNGEPIRLVLRPDADIDTTILAGLSPAMGKAMKAAHSHPGMIVAVTDPESDEAVAKTPGSLGTAALSSILVEKAPLNVLALNGIKPSVKTLANGTYPLAKDIRFITTKHTPPATLKFIDFIYSPQGRAIAGKAGVLVPVGR